LQISFTISDAAAADFAAVSTFICHCRLLHKEHFASTASTVAMHDPRTSITDQPEHTIIITNSTTLV
jgi:hypothetical protein